MAYAPNYTCTIKITPSFRQLDIPLFVILHILRVSQPTITVMALGQQNVGRPCCRVCCVETGCSSSNERRCSGIFTGQWIMCTGRSAVHNKFWGSFACDTTILSVYRNCNRVTFQLCKYLFCIILVFVLYKNNISP